MTTSNIATALSKYGTLIPRENVYFLQHYLTEASDDCMNELMSLPMKGKTKTLLFSIFLGGVAVDRFYVGDIGEGAVKLMLRVIGMILTMFSAVPVLGVLFLLASTVWQIIDIFNTYKIAAKVNYENITTFLIRYKETAQSEESQL